MPHGAGSLSSAPASYSFGPPLSASAPPAPAGYPLGGPGAYYTDGQLPAPPRSTPRSTDSDGEEESQIREEDGEVSEEHPQPVEEVNPECCVCLSEEKVSCRPKMACGSPSTTCIIIHIF